MKSWIVLIVAGMILSWIWLFPKEDDVLLVNQGKINVDMIVVELSGAVEMPGQYHLFEPMTLSEVLSYGKKLSDDADLTQINLSEIIDNDRHIVIPSVFEEVDTRIVKININQASFKELITIPGMTETRAVSLLIYREAHGSFKSLDELINVKYIGFATLEKIKPYLTLS